MRRRLNRFAGVPVRPIMGLAVSVVLALSAGLSAVYLWPRDSGATYGVPPDVPQAVDKSLGINADLHTYSPVEREAALAAMEAAGLRWLRLCFAWDVVEASRGSYAWGVWDEIVEAAERHNLQILALLNRSPGWARAVVDQDNPQAPPADLKDFGAFAAAVASRYGDDIDHYQIWDEPNIAPHWGAREVEPWAYARFLREATIEIREVDAQATIMTAALAPNVEAGGANMSDVRFLEALYDDGADTWFDIVAGQPYGFGRPLAEPPDEARLNWSRLALLRDVIERRGSAGTAIWATSFGWEQGARVGPGTDTESIGTVIEAARRDWPWLGPMLWAAWAPSDVHGEYALTGERVGAGEARAELETAASAPGQAWPGNYPANHESGRYEGSWRVRQAGADIGESGDRLTIPFWGTRFDLTLRRGAYRAFLYASIDGSPANALPTDHEGRAYLVLYDPLGATATVPLATDLPDAEHIAEIVAERGWGQWAIAGWTVSREPTGALRWLPGLLALGAVLSLGVALHWSRGWGERVCGGWRQMLELSRRIDDRVVLVVSGVVALLLYVVVGTGPSMVVLALLALLLILRPQTGLLLIMVALPFYQLGKPLLGRTFSMVEILTLLTALGWAVTQITDSPGRSLGARVSVRSLTRQDWLVVALVTISFLSLIWSQQTREAARELRTVILEGALFYAMVRCLTKKEGDLWRLSDAWVLGGTLIAAVGLYQWVAGQNLIMAQGVARVRGFYGSPNNLALYLGRALPLGVVVAVWSDGDRRRWLYGVAGLLMATAVVLTYSRGAWLIGLPAAMLFVAAVRGRRFVALTVAALCLLAIVVFLLTGGSRLAGITDIVEGTTAFRLQLWRSSWAMVRDHPLLGVGLDNFLYQYRSHYVQPTAWEEFNLSHPHNVILDVWLRLGLAGLVIMGWLTIVVFRRAWQTYQRLDRESRSLALLLLGVMGSVVYSVAHGFVDNAFFLVDLAFLFLLAAAVVQNASVLAATFESSG